MEYINLRNIRDFIYEMMSFGKLNQVHVMHSNIQELDISFAYQLKWYEIGSN